MTKNVVSNVIYIWPIIYYLLLLVTFWLLLGYHIDFNGKNLVPYLYKHKEKYNKKRQKTIEVMSEKLDMQNVLDNTKLTIQNKKDKNNLIICKCLKCKIFP